MCGICGIHTTYITSDHEKLIDSIVNNQSRRGPDHHAVTVVRGNHSQAILGHNRLSIIDLSEHANQPMWDVTGRFCIVYNGEIYNYIELQTELKTLGIYFKTASDTEVILNAFLYWGIDCLKRFHGPFSFSIFDKKTEELWLCRDRFGVRPLYYTQQNNSLYFASTTTVLAKKLNMKPNLGYIAKGLKYLVYEDGSDSTPYLNMLSLPAGCYLRSVFDNNGTLSYSIQSYYNLEAQVQNKIHSLSLHNTHDLLGEISSTLDRAVHIRLRSDVPLGISLSGGLDSSSVAALVSRQHSNTIGFSFSHPDDKQSEGRLVKNCANYLNIKIEYVWPTAHEMIDALHNTIAAQDAPFSTFSIVAQYMLYQHVRSSGVKVLLGGQGGDEAFMGYKKFLLFQLQQGIKQKRVLTTAKNVLGLIPMMASELPSIKAYWQHRHRYSNTKHISDSALLLPESTELRLGHLQQDLWKRQLDDVTQFSLPTLLRYEDRNAMGNSVESRLPYMDHQLVELGLALPESIKLHAGYGKWAIRKIMHNKIPNQIRLARYKRGFDVPLIPLLNAGLGKSIRTALQDNRHVISDFLKHPMQIDHYFSDHQLMQRKNSVSEAITLLWLTKAFA